MFRKLLDEGQAGDNVGVLLRGTKREEVERGQVLAKPGAITPHTKFEGEVYVLTKEEGGGTRRSSRVSATVLLPHDGRDGVGGVAGRGRDGDAGRQHQDDDRADQPDRDGRGSALCHPRGRSSTVGAGVVSKILKYSAPSRCRSVRRRPVAQLAERRSPKPQVGGSIPSWPASRNA